jgi:LSD1 subclass zinc finger protein
MASEQTTAKLDSTLTCNGCGAPLAYVPGTDTLKCSYCGTVNKIDTSKDAAVQSNDYGSFIEKRDGDNDTQTSSVVKCRNCGATVTLLPNVTADNCPFCSTPLVINANTAQQITKPDCLLPFTIKKEVAIANFKDWAKKLKFAPNALYTIAERASSQQLEGIYLPYWSYDFETISQYRGSRGTYYYRTQISKDTNGNPETKQVQDTQWLTVEGVVNGRFSHILVAGSNSLPKKLTDHIGPWDFTKVRPYDQQYIAGLRAETYQIEASTTIAIAEKSVNDSIDNLIHSDIGGNKQTVDHVDTSYQNVKVLYMLLPVWLCAYKYNGKVYHMVVNANTGAISGERPYSIIKIALRTIYWIAIAWMIIETFRNS